MSRDAAVIFRNLPGIASKVLTAFVWLVIAAALARIAISDQQFQWDFRVFHAAPVALESGENPYDNTAPGLNIPATLSYLYPPIVLYMFKPLSELPFPVAYVVWFSIKLLALALLLRLWHQHFERLNTSWPTVLFFVLAFNSAILRDFTAGNLATLEQLGLWTGFYFLIRERPYAAGAILALTAQVKLMPIVFLGLLLLGGPGEARQWKPLLASLAIFVGLFSLNYVFMPEMTTHYLASFASGNPNLDERGEINPSSLSMLRDAGELLKSVGLPWAKALILPIYCLFVASLGAAALGALFKYSDKLRTMDQRPLIYLGCVLFVLVMPRVKDYTYMALLIPALFVLRHADVRPLVPLVAVLLFLPPTNSYVPGLGRSMVHWLQTYMPWIVACVLGYYLIRHIAHAVGQPATQRGDAQGKQDESPR